jgi:outer membrane receptor protein involved in Fe transport
MLVLGGQLSPSRAAGRPRHTLRGRVLDAKGVGHELAWAERFELGLESELVAEKHRVNRVLMGRAWELSLRANNLLDKRYRGFLSRYKEFADNPGRDVRLMVSTSF